MNQYTVGTMFKYDDRTKKNLYQISNRCSWQSCALQTISFAYSIFTILFCCKHREYIKRKLFQYRTHLPWRLSFCRFTSRRIRKRHMTEYTHTCSQKKKHWPDELNETKESNFATDFNLEIVNARHSEIEAIRYADREYNERKKRKERKKQTHKNQKTRNERRVVDSESFSHNAFCKYFCFSHKNHYLKNDWII